MAFPEDVTVEILSWLPVKSLTRFKCVSKSWRQLLSNDYRFMKLHFNRSFQANNNNNNSNTNPNPGIIFCSKGEDEKSRFHYAEDITACGKATVLRSKDLPNCFHVVNVCNGLVCLADSIIGYNQSRFYVWNPITGDHITIPCPLLPSDFFCDGHHEFAVMFVFRFEYIEATDEYKLIFFVTACHLHRHGEVETIFYVYTFSTGSWRTLQGVPMYIHSRKHKHNGSAVLVNGAIHWLASKIPYFETLDNHEIIFAFNTQDETFEEIPLPGCTHYDIYSECTPDVIVGELGGLLSFACRLQRAYVEIWVMEEYGVADSWKRLCKIEHPRAYGKYLIPLGAVDSGEIIISKNTREWISYDRKNSSVRDLHMFEFEVLSADIFRGSLLSPTIINGARIEESAA